MKKNKKDLRKEIIKALEGKKKISEVMWNSVYGNLAYDTLKYCKNDEERDFVYDIMEFIEENYEER